MMAALDFHCIPASTVSYYYFNVYSFARLSMSFYGCRSIWVRNEIQITSLLLIRLEARFCLPFSFDDTRQFAGVTDFRCVDWYMWSSGLTRRCHGERVRVMIYPSWAVCAFSSLVCKLIEVKIFTFAG